MHTLTIFYSLLIFYVTFKIVYAKPVEEDISYVEKVNFEYKNDKWICGDIECPEETFGCKIRIRNDENDPKVLYQSFNCFDKDQNGLLGAGDIINLSKAKTINIKLETYAKAVSVYGVGYGAGGHENAEGVVAVEDLKNLKEDFRMNKKKVEDSFKN